MIWFRSANSHTGPQLHRCIRGRTDGSIRLRATLLKNRLHLEGLPQMSSRPSLFPVDAGRRTLKAWSRRLDRLRSAHGNCVTFRLRKTDAKQRVFTSD